MNSILRRTCLIVATVMVVAACQRPDPDGAASATAAPVTDSSVSTTAPTTTPVETTAPPSTTVESTVPATSAPESTAPATIPPATTVPATTTAPSTTEAPDPESPDDLILAFDGIRPLAFGTTDANVVSTLVAVLGDPISDDSTEYETPEAGRFVNESLEEAFASRFGRTVCFTNGLCTQFGAGSATALQFVGWEFGGDDAAGLATEDGITVGSLWSDHAEAIVADEGGCFAVGYGAADGVDIIMQSSGEPFVKVTAGGGFELGSPDPADVTVISLSAGDLPIQLFADC